MESLTSADMEQFLEETINLHRDAVTGYRAQVQHLRERLAQHVAEHPDFTLQKMLHFGSLAKGTALSTLREMDVAVYLRPDGIPTRDLTQILQEVRKLLLQVYPTMAPSQITIDPPAVTVAFEGSGLQVDVVPVLPNGKPDDRGILVLRAGGDWVETSIPLHLAFVKDRAQRHPQFRPLIRLAKWWAQECEVPLPSFIIELLWAHLFRSGAVPDDLQQALLAFFGYVVRSELRDRIVFTDNYQATQVPAFTDPVRIVDPVNPSNNVGALIPEGMRQEIITKSYAALDAIAAASSAYSRSGGIDFYRRVLGSRFAA